MNNTEVTLYDVVRDLDKTIRTLSDFKESEALDVEHLVRILNTVRNTITSQLD